MKKLIFLIILSMIIISCNQEISNQSDYLVSLELTGFKDSTMFKLLDLDRSEFIDSTYIINGELEFKGELDEPFSARIHTVDNKYLILWIEEGKIFISGDYDNFGTSRIEGSSLNDVMTKYRDKQVQLQTQRDSLMQEMIKLRSSGETNAKEKFQELYFRVKEIDQRVVDIRVQGILTEAPSYYTIKELYFLRNDFSKDSLKFYFKKFPEKFQNTKYGEVIQIYIENKSIEVGDHYIDIEGLNEDGQLIKLSELEGKYILLDFWASWCGPCRKENPNLVKVYKDFKDNGFEIFSFSIDDNIDSWKKAVEKDSLIWTNVIDENGSYSKMSALYGVRAIPASFLINPEGIIIAKNLRGKALEDKLNEELSNNDL